MLLSLPFKAIWSNDFYQKMFDFVKKLSVFLSSLGVVFQVLMPVNPVITVTITFGGFTVNYFTSSNCYRQNIYNSWPGTTSVSVALKTMTAPALHNTANVFKQQQTQVANSPSSGVSLAHISRFFFFLCRNKCKHTFGMYAISLLVVWLVFFACTNSGTPFRNAHALSPPQARCRGGDGRRRRGRGAVLSLGGWSKRGGEESRWSIWSWYWHAALQAAVSTGKNSLCDRFFFFL